MSRDALILCAAVCVSVSAAIRAYGAPAEAGLPPGRMMPAPAADAAIAVTQDAGLTRQEKIEKARQLYSHGEQLLEDGNFVAADDALKRAQRLLEESIPRQAPLRLNEAPASDDDGVAVEERVWPASKAWELSQEGASEEAVGYYLKAIDLEPGRADLYYNLGVEYLKTGQYAFAVKAFKESLRLDPKDAFSCYNLGVLYEDYLKEKKQALEYYRKFLKLAPNAEEAPEVKRWIQELINYYSEDER